MEIIYNMIVSSHGSLSNQLICKHLYGNCVYAISTSIHLSCLSKLALDNMTNSYS